MSYDFNDYKKDAMDRPSSKAWSNWAKFKNKGDKVSGYIRDVFYRKAEGAFKDARGITLEQPDGSLINVSIRRLDFILSKTNNLHIGDPLTIVFEDEIPAKMAGYNATKQYGFYGKNLPENAAGKTVAELEAIDMGLGGQTRPTEAGEEDDDFTKAAGGETPPAAPVN